MATYTKESLETLRVKVDLIDLLSAHVDLKRQGAVYKALCPFHDEKSPSFSVQKGARHYHCFGCGAHGDAIQFLVEYQRMSFPEAVEALAERFRVPLELIEGNREEGAIKKQLYACLEFTSRVYEAYLLHSEAGKQALQYLYERGFDLNFIKKFRIGLVPENERLFTAILAEKKFGTDLQKQAGILTERGHFLFSSRISIPIQDVQGRVIGFSCRKWNESAFGAGKYINTPETLLFKKSRVLFGLNYVRRNLAKEQTAILVEGQFDVLRLLHHGFSQAVAAQGTAFGKDHAEELERLGVKRAILIFDGDKAGQQAAVKTGHLLLQKGIDVDIVHLGEGQDPDGYLVKEGPYAFKDRLAEKKRYLEFLIDFLKQGRTQISPMEKSVLVHEVATRIREWRDPIVIQGSLEQAARLLEIPEEFFGIRKYQGMGRNLYTTPARLEKTLNLNQDLILELDCLRWVFLLKNKVALDFLKNHLQKEDFLTSFCRELYQALDQEEFPDLLTLASEMKSEKVQECLEELVSKRIPKERVDQYFPLSIQKILDRNWMRKREKVRLRLQSGRASDEEALRLAKEFDALKNNPPKISAGEFLWNST